MVDKSDFYLYPLIGIGGGGLSLSFKDPAEASFEEVLKDHRRYSVLTTGLLLFHASIGMDWMWIIRSRQHYSGGFVFGLRAGYIFSATEANWSIKGNVQAKDGPNIDLSGFYLQLAIGGGGKDFDVSIL